MNHDTTLIKMLKHVAEAPSLFASNRRAVVLLAIETIEQQQRQIESQVTLIAGLRSQLSHLQAHSEALAERVEQWHTVADARSREIVRLMNQMRDRERS